MTKPSELTSTEFTRLYNELKQKIADESPIYNKPGSGGPQAPVEPDIQGHDRDMSEANGYLEKWYKYAGDGDFNALATVNGESPWATLYNSRRELSAAKSTLTTAKDNLSANWTGVAAGEYVSYLNAAQRRFEDFINGDDRCLDRARGLLREAYAAEAGFKQGLHELATAASKAIDTFTEQHAKIVLTAGLGVGVILAGATVAALSGGIAGAVLGTVGATLGAEAFGAAKNDFAIVGNDPVAIMRTLDAGVTILLENYATAADDVAAKMDELIGDLKAYGSKEGMLELPPEVGPAGTSFRLKDFFPKDATGDQQVIDRIKRS